MIRQLEAGDEGALEELCRQFKNRVPSPEEARRVLADAGFHVFAAIEDGTIVGFSSCYVLNRIDGDVSVFLYELEVTEECRRRGIGRALVEAARHVAEEVGAVRMWVQTDDDNVAARRTYTSAGASRAGSDRSFVWRFGASAAPTSRGARGIPLQGGAPPRCPDEQPSADTKRTHQKRHARPPATYPRPLKKLALQETLRRA
jgi:GNAT superfamily N-acetyltransferase